MIIIIGQFDCFVWFDLLV